MCYPNILIYNQILFTLPKFIQNMNHRQLFLNHLAQTSPTPLALEIVHAEGLYLHDKDGKKYIDLIAGISVSVLGHRHQAVVHAIKEQVDSYLHTLVYGEFILSPQIKLASLLTSHLPPNLSSVYLVNSGTEATEGAMKLAKKHTGRSEIISAKFAYHGSTQGAASLMFPHTFTEAYFPFLPHIHHIDFNCISCLDRITNQTAAVILETVQAEYGVRLPSGNFLQQIAKKCKETGTLLILDEIQAGMGRTGSLFAFNQYDVVPDILLLAKGLGGGMPIGAFISSKEIMSGLSENPVLGHITTFGGHPVSAAAAFSTLQFLVESDLIGLVETKSKRFISNLCHPMIKEIRHAGLLMAVDLDDASLVQKVIHLAIYKGLITDWFLFNDRCLRIAPPLTITFEEIDKACEILLSCFKEIKI
jgi:acetylornithine/succinyldiaminopimelate/putrescine aminotransferase